MSAIARTLTAGTLRDLVLQYNVAPATKTVVEYLAVSFRDAESVISSPEFQAEIERQTRLSLRGDAAAARRLLRSQMDDANLHPKIRQDAARTLLAVGGYVAPKAGDMAKAPESLADMTSEQLRSFLGRIEGELGSRAKPVDAPNPVEPDSQALDML